MNLPYSVPIPTAVAPGQTVDVSMLMRAPIKPGNYRGNFKFQNAAGVQFGLGRDKENPFWVEINVQESITTFDFVERICSAQWLSGAGTLPCPGREGDSRGSVIGVNKPKLENGVIDDKPGLLTLPQRAENGFIIGIYPSYLVQSGDRFQSIVNCEAGAENCLVVFRLDYQSGSDSIQTFWAFVEQYEGISYQADLDLSPLAGQEVKFILSVFAAGPADDDRAIWGAPQIVHKFVIPTDVTKPIYPNYRHYPIGP
jgi:hypothetical protein